VANVLNTALAKEPDDRYQAARIMVEALNRLVEAPL
jgi:hypothetical protein